MARNAAEQTQKSQLLPLGDATVYLMETWISPYSTAFRGILSYLIYFTFYELMLYD